MMTAEDNHIICSVATLYSNFLHQVVRALAVI